MIAKMGGWEVKSMKNLRFLLGVIIVGSLCLVAIMTWRTLPPPQGKKAPVKEPSIAADLQLNRVKYTETREGIKEWELEAASVRYFEDENTLFFEQVKATFFGKNQETYVLVGKRGKINTQTKALEVFDGVKLDSSDGYQMQTQSLKYQAERRELMTSDPVEMSGPQLRVQGTGLIVELNRQRMKVLKQVTTTFFHSTQETSRGSL
ncbi:MAG: LPS export ABC transporter periplasmic protein LptC [Deltaproteobacteria bacterium]|nr:LPS export ABC transporter periplasmic protein LptC [Deltaproteobacteria bacterium]